MRSIFLGQLRSKEKLPTEQQLSEQFQVDRTSLRVALKQLEAMGVLEIRQGDGMYVRDFVKHAGLDFLRMLFTQHESEQDLLDEYLMDEIWEFWILLFPQVLELAMDRKSTRNIRGLVLLVDREIEVFPNREEIAALELEMQDAIAQICNNTIILLLFNSSRPLRSRMLQAFLNGISDDELRQHMETKKMLLQSLLSRDADKTAIAGAFRARLELYRRTTNDSMRAAANLAAKQTP